MSGYRVPTPSESLVAEMQEAAEVRDYLRLARAAGKAMSLNAHLREQQRELWHALQDAQEALVALLATDEPGNASSVLPHPETAPCSPTPHAPQPAA